MRSSLILFAAVFSVPCCVHGGIIYTITDDGVNTTVSTDGGTLDVSNAVNFSGSVTTSAPNFGYLRELNGLIQLGASNKSVSMDRGIYSFGSVTRTPSSGWTETSSSGVIISHSGTTPQYLVSNLSFNSLVWNKVGQGTTQLSNVTFDASSFTMAGDLSSRGLTADESVVLDFGLDTITIQTFEAAAVPEPSTFALLGICMAGCGLRRRRKRTA